MKIIQISTSDIQGGAARAAYRLHRGLIAIEQDSRLLTVHRQSADPSVQAIDRVPAAMTATATYLSTIQSQYINANRTGLSNTSFTLPYPGFDISYLPSVHQADVINLHWVAYFQSPITLKKLLNLGKPIVWTLHDMWAFTGGCHYSDGCSGYQQTCSDCPQLQHDPFHLPSVLLKDKMTVLAESSLTIVTPSQWLADCAKKSQLFHHQRVEVIPYSLETEVFRSLPKPVAKQAIDLAPDTFALLIGADDGNEIRKGFGELFQALKLCLSQPELQQWIAHNRLQLLCFGVPNQHLKTLGIPIVSFGEIKSDDRLAQIYAAADLFVLPSLEDNLPNTMLEAMSCGTPVLAFQAGGIPDVVQNNVTGKLVASGDIQGLADAILECVLSGDRCQQMGAASRKVMEEQHALPIQAERYLYLYDELLSTNSPATNVILSTPHSKQSERDIAPVSIDTAMGAVFANVFPAIAFPFVEQRLQETVDRVQQLAAELQQVKTELTQTQAELTRAQAEIVAMKTSKFWQLRSLWFRVKRSIGISTNELS